MPTGKEHTECEYLIEKGSEVLLETNDDRILGQAKTAGDPDPVHRPVSVSYSDFYRVLRSDDASDHDSAVEIDRVKQASPIPSPMNAAAEADSRNSGVNKTTFAFWPSPESARITMPEIASLDLRLSNERKRNLFAAELHYGPQIAHEKRWCAEQNFWHLPRVASFPFGCALTKRRIFEKVFMDPGKIRFFVQILISYIAAVRDLA
ncbi:hypothetical protein BDU57DRAFT_572457 [Ampelomyces quisqualis]|uniref:Uncharacterized protein n=1 Tax=Ampelomyces quisqualis TaxID=50730 RepID=A0A6A5QSD0_AMPQU|nr:hypothetical protein BDU57DRAFT_572457 [Ampelomyces quisqualis]